VVLVVVAVLVVVVVIVVAATVTIAVQAGTEGRQRYSSNPLATLALQ
jgi:hypothetical protein